jgi:hypothetical protein
MMRRVIWACLIIVTLSELATINAQTIASSNEQQKRKIFKQVAVSPAIQVYADNSQGNLLYIQEASVKELSGDDFKILVGEAPKHFKQTTFPDVILFNSSGKTIKSFGVAVQSAADKPRSGHILLKNNLSILPNSTYKVASSEWPQAERVSIEKGGKFETRMQQPGLDSAKSWIPGTASDLRVTVGFIEFEDGTRWIISGNSGL